MMANFVLAIGIDAIGLQQYQRIMISLLAALVVLPAALLTILLAAPAISADFPLPVEGNSIANFVPPGWRIWKQVSGDLNFDGRKDYAFILISGNDDPEGGFVENDERLSRRPLIVLFSTPNSKLRLACQSPGAIIWGKEANDLAINTINIDIKQGNLIVRIGNGATNILAYVSTYRWQHGRIELIGLTESHGRLVEPAGDTKLDSNLNTSYEEDAESSEAGGARETKISYYFLRAASQAHPPVLGTSEEEWSGLPVQLRRAVNVVLGRTVWHNPSDLSAELKAAVAENNLFIACRVTDKNPDEHICLRLRTEGGRIIAATKVEKRVTQYGETINAQFPLANLKQDFDRTIRASVQLVKTDSTGKPLIILSTSADGEKHSGAIRLRKTASLPTLANFEWTNRDD